jgi:hypothetical protein
MISVKPNPNFSNWFQVISFGKLIDEYSRRSKALKVASKMALQHQHKYIVVDGIPKEVEAK